MIGRFVRLARPTQWAKSAFVLVGPFYGYSSLADRPGAWKPVAFAAGLAAVAFALVSSASYVVNDILDAPADRSHPRKRNRPIASGEVSPGQAAGFALALLVGAVAAVAMLPTAEAMWGVGLWVVAYVVNVNLYSMWLKHVVLADVMGLSLGFVIRVFGGCAAVGVVPSSWLLNSTLFLAMFLAFGKRLGERRTMGSAEAASTVRAVQSAYTDELLRMMVVVTGVATLITYAGYVTAHESDYVLAWDGVRVGGGVNLLWITMVPATYCLLRCIVILERGDYDDPTELAMRDRPFQLSFVAFATITLVLILAMRAPYPV
ncbi:MAG: UbiA family prenyltransferase [Phycisphaeraceae bacterium]|nr:UbiA family prenyltransferase [Phycisphaeraceae bacterium]